MTDWVEECDENVDATIEAWMNRRAEPCFRDGWGWPEGYARLGGSQGYDPQGNAMVEDTNADTMLFQTAHSDGFGWNSVGFSIPKVDLMGGDWSSVKFRSVDAA
jgi:hypothetical protein